MSLRMVLETGNIGGVAHMISTGSSCMMVVGIGFLGCFLAFGPELEQWRTARKSSDSILPSVDEEQAGMNGTQSECRHADTAEFHGG